jgi:hypothetical protein
MMQVNGVTTGPGKESELRLLNNFGLRKMKPPAQKNHVPPRRIWSFIYDNMELDVPEQRHLNICLYCADVFKLCVTTESYDRMMREIPAEDSESRAA